MISSNVLRLSLVACVIFSFATFALASERHSEAVRPSQTSMAPTTIWLDCNRVKLNLTNIGTLNENAGNLLGGGYWPDSNLPLENVIIFDLGPWVIGKINDVPMMGISQWGSSYSPGPAINGQAAMLVKPADSMRYRTYKINRGDNGATSTDYREWPVDLGAPLDLQGRPKLLGQQTLWSVFNNLDPSAPSGWWQTHMPNPGLPVVIQQTVYAQNPAGGDTSSLLNNVVFIEWKVVNAGTVAIESTYVSLWTDIDFDDASANRPAVDTTNQLGYCWQAREPRYGPPRAVGMVLLHGPSVPAPGNEAVFMGQKRPGYRNLPLSGFWGILDDSYQDASFYGPAYSMATAWNITRGYDKLGNPVLDSVTHEVTKFPYGGDPVTGTGWVATRGSGGAGFNMFTGPFTLAPGDSQWVMFALLPVSDTSRFQAIVRLRQEAATLRGMPYNALVLTDVNGMAPSIPSKAILDQNYPNPFNPSTTIRYGLPVRSQVMLKVFNSLGQQLAILQNGELDAGEHEVTFNARDLPSGVYFYRLQTGNYTETKRLLLLR
jgi:hypothetical protein